MQRSRTGKWPFKTSWHLTVLALAAASLWQCADGQTRALDAPLMPPTHAYFGRLDLDRAPRSHPIYPFVTEVPDWLAPNLLSDPEHDIVYDGLVGRGAIDMYRICWGEGRVKQFLERLPSLHGKHVALFGSGAIGMVHSMAQAVGHEGSITVFSPSWKEVALVRSDRSLNRHLDNSPVSARTIDLDAPSLGPMPFDAIIVADLSLLLLEPHIPPVIAMADSMARALTPDGLLVVVQRPEMRDGLWHQGQFEKTGSIAAQHRLFAQVGLSHHLPPSEVCEDASSTLYALHEASLSEAARTQGNPVVLPEVPRLCHAAPGGIDVELRRPIEAYRIEFFRPVPSRLALELLPPVAGRDVLEIGAGAGHFTFPLAAAVGKMGSVVALDIDPLWSEMLLMRHSAASTTGAPVRTHQPTGSGFGLAPSSVDLAVAMQVPDVFIPTGEHANWEAIGQFLDALRLVLRPGGQFALVVLADGQLSARAAAAEEFYARNGFSLLKKAVVPFDPPATITGIAVWASCYRETAHNWFYLFSVD